MNLYDTRELYYQIELFAAGTAVVLDSALLLIVRERINRPFVVVWLRTLVLGTILFHLGYFGRVMIWKVDPEKAIHLDHLMMCSISIGLLLMPSGMLHAAIRIFHTGLDAKPKREVRYGLIYAPIFFLPALFFSILSAEDRSFLDSISWFTPFYLVWLLSANLASIVFFAVFQWRAKTPIPFLAKLIGALLLVSVGAVCYVLMSRDLIWEPALRLIVCLSPLLLEVVFVWYTLKHRVLPLVLDRSLLYAASLILGLLLHQLVISPFTSYVREQVHVDLSILEAIALIGVFLLVPSLRVRFREALRYLFSTNVFRVRDATRLLSVSLSRQGNLEPSLLLQWFANELADKLDLDMACIVIAATPEIDSNLTAYVSNMPGRARSQKESERSAVEDWASIARAVQAAERLERGMVAPQVFGSRQELDALSEAIQAMARRGVLLAFRLSFPTVHGAVLLGDRKRNDKLADEQMISIALLCDQLAATLGNKNESLKRAQLERRFMQNEKLSTLGLIAGSLAHELRNPLSSIRTIASLTMEELGPDHANRRDLSIIVGEIDKLTQTTTRLLDSARPADDQSSVVSPDAVITKLLTLLTPLAKQLHVSIQTDLHCAGILIQSSEVSVSEVFFNLIKNGIEAATGREQAWVKVVSRSVNRESIEIAVMDNGPGIDESLLKTIFEPFVTGKSSGTGLGLFVVAERIKELRGEIVCRRDLDLMSTEFVVTLPTISLEVASASNK